MGFFFIRNELSKQVHFQQSKSVVNLMTKKGHNSHEILWSMSIKLMHT